MDIASIAYRSQSYKTTNPPISESTEFAVSKTVNFYGEARCELRVGGDCNGESFKQTLVLTEKQFDALVRSFIRLRLKEAMLAMLEAPALPPEPAFTGGSFSETLSFTANGVTVTASKAPPDTGLFVTELRTLAAELGGDNLFPKRAAPGAVCPSPQMVPPAPQPTDTPKGAWFCPQCGTQNTGSFCMECGQRKA